MCVKTHLKHATDPFELLKYVSIGVPLILIGAWLLSQPVYELCLWAIEVFELGSCTVCKSFLLIKP